MAASMKISTCQNRLQCLSRVSISYATFFFCSFFFLANGDFYSYRVEDVKGREISLEVFRGKPALVVNVASECGYTKSHYEDLVWVSQQPEISDGLHILAFPCNQFGAQEPNENEEILSFAQHTYGATFPIFGKIDVIGQYAHPAFTYLINASGKRPNWNFWKYLIDRQGRVIDAWEPTTGVREIYGFLVAATKTPQPRRVEF